jgi:hypothetical protein
MKTTVEEVKWVMKMVKMKKRVIKLISVLERDAKRGERGNQQPFWERKWGRKIFF